MRRITDLRCKKVKKEIDKPIIKSEEPLTIELHRDILHILQGYESRIKIKTESKKVTNIYKPSYERYILYTNPSVFTLDVYPFINLETVIIKNCNELNLDLLSSRPLKTVYISNISHIHLQKDLQIEELYLKNIKVKIDVLLKILSSSILKSINFNNVVIISEDGKVCDRSSTINSTNEQITNEETSYNVTQHMMSFTSIDEVRYREYNMEIQNSQSLGLISDMISSMIEHNVNIKACSFINTNISLNSLINTGILRRLHSFTYVKDTDYIFISYNTSLFNLLETNIEIDCDCIDFVNIEKLAVKNLSMFKLSDLSDVRSLDLQNTTICSDVLDDIVSRFPKISEIGFLSCDFSSNAFYKMMDLFKDKIRKLNLKDSLIPLNSLEYLKENLRQCKVIFRDGNVFSVDNE